MINTLCKIHILYSCSNENVHTLSIQYKFYYPVIPSLFFNEIKSYQV